MPKFSALVRATQQDIEFLPRCLESVKIANDVVLIDADRDESVRKIGRQHGGRVLNGIPGVTPGAYLTNAFHNWILVIRPFEELSTDLIRSLEEWKRQKRDDTTGYGFGIIEQSGQSWIPRKPELRLVNRKLINWMGDFPPNTSAPLLPGSILRHRELENQERIAS